MRLPKGNCTHRRALETIGAAAVVVGFHALFACVVLLALVRCAA